MPLNPEEENSILRDVGVSIIDSINQPWERIEMYFAATHRMSRSVITAAGTNGEDFYPILAMSTEALLMDLRSGMHRNETGTWFSLKYTITSEKKYYVDFDYDNEPDFGFEIDPYTYYVDLQKFPRPDDQLPEWIRDKIRQASED